MPLAGGEEAGQAVCGWRPGLVNGEVGIFFLDPDHQPESVLCTSFDVVQNSFFSIASVQLVYPACGGTKVLCWLTEESKMLSLPQGASSRVAR